MYKGQYYCRETRPDTWHIFQVRFASSLAVSAVMLYTEPTFSTEQQARDRIRQLNAERFLSESKQIKDT